MKTNSEPVKKARNGHRMRRAMKHVHAQLEPVRTVVAISFAIVLLAWTGGAEGFSNGGLSDDPSSPKYGTHDWFAEHALDFLPSEEKAYLLEFKEAYIFGTELPDNGDPEAGLNDKSYHHVYFYSDGSLQDDVGSRRAWSEFNRTINLLNYGERELAARHAGIMSHYMADVTIFAHVMGQSTDWGAEEDAHHSGFETYINERTSTYESTLNQALVFDGALTDTDAYEATLAIGYNTTFGDGASTEQCTWMNSNYDWDDHVFSGSANASINRGVNLLADVLHTISLRAGTGNVEPADHVLITEVYYDTPGTDSVEEYVELHNPTANSVDIGGWKLQDPGATFTIPQDSSLTPYSYFTAARDLSGFRNLFGKDPDVAGLSISMSNSGDYLKLMNGDDIEVDFVAWEDKRPSWDIRAKTGRVMERVPVAADTDTNADWVSNSLPSPMTQSEGVPLPDNDGDGNPDISDLDDDNDGLLDEEEAQLGTDQFVPDTDGDDCTDSDDYYPLDSSRCDRERGLTSSEALAVGGVVAIVGGIYYFVRVRRSERRKKK
jgi:hypothetical protein